jgi:CRISPR system Cascade subunit CasE
MSVSVCYLTRALVSAGTIFQRGLRDGYAWHQLVWKAFPDRDGQARDFLTRLDTKSGGTQLLIISPTVPTRPEWLTDRDQWETKEIPLGYFQSRTYRFQLHANPTVKRVVRGPDGVKKKNGRREPITDEGELRSWLDRKGQAGGFELLEDAPLLIETDVTRFKKKPKDAESPGTFGTHGTVDFSGVLHVTDPALFLTHTFAKGLGSAKAFGFGLLVVAPVSF